MAVLNFVFIVSALIVQHVFSSKEVPENVQRITQPYIFGDAPHWDSVQQVLWLVDVDGHTIHKYDPIADLDTSTDLGKRVSFIIPVQGSYDKFVVGVEKEVQVIRWDGQDGSCVDVLKILAIVDTGLPTRTNEAKCDSEGRLFFGTLQNNFLRILNNDNDDYKRGQGSLYRLLESDVDKLVGDITVSSGLAWDFEKGFFYYADAADRKIRRYDYNVYNGDISSNYDIVFDFYEYYSTEVPGGISIDTDGNLWIAVYGGSEVIQIDPETGVLLRKVYIPESGVTSLTFGGPDLDILFVTTTMYSNDDSYSAGATYLVSGLGVRGYPNEEFKLY